jgi:hypothetical protein
MVDEEFFSAETIGKATSFKPQATREGGNYLLAACSLKLAAQNSFRFKKQFISIPPNNSKFVPPI